MCTMKNLVPRVTLEFRGLDSVTTKEDIEKALMRDLEGKTGDARVSNTKPNRREQVIAIVHINEQDARKLLEASRIKVGWIYSRIRPRTRVDRCFKCLGYGHHSRDCKGPDRSSLCYKCGKEGYKGVLCTEKLQCKLSTEMKENPETLQHVQVRAHAKHSDRH